MTKYPIPDVVLPLFNTEQKEMANKLLREAREDILSQRARMLCYALRRAASCSVCKHLAWGVADHLQYAIHDSLSGCATYTEWVIKHHPEYSNNDEILVQGRIQWIDNILEKLNDV